MTERPLSERPAAFVGDQILARSPGGRFPLAGQWELTCRCNLRCAMCYTDCFNTPERIRRELAAAEIFRILDELHGAGCLELTFTGGEPLARPDFMEIYERAHRLGFLVSVFTNGTLVTEEIARRWSQAMPRGVEISLHGVSAAVFEGVTRVPGSLARCLAAVRLLVERRIPLTLKTVGMTLNRDEILAVKRYADGLGPGVSFRFDENLRDGLNSDENPLRFQLPEEDLRAIEHRDPELWSAKQERLAPSAPASKGCRGGRGTFHIDAYGRLQLCTSNRRAGYNLRKGPFQRGFYEALPSFPCPAKAPSSAPPSPARRPVAPSGEGQ